MRMMMKLTTATLAAVTCLLSVQSGWAFYNPQTGRWLNRDPIGERGGNGLDVFIANNPSDAIDPLGQRCCLTWIHAGPRSIAGHSILHCDNGAHVSFSHLKGDETDPIQQWHSPARDQLDYDDPPYPPPPAPRTTDCFDCLDEAKVMQWITEQQASGRRWTVFNNCADTTLAAIEAGLPDQSKPNCPRVSCDLAVRGCSNRALNLLQQLPDGTSPTLVNPSDAQHRMQRLIANGCNRWQCTIVCIRY
jgi:RHS repeat-associated protein